MNYTYLKRRIFYYSSFSLDFLLFFALSFLILFLTDSKIGSNVRPSDNGLDLIITKGLEIAECGVAEAEEIPHRILWHIKGMLNNKLSRPQGLCLDHDSSRIYVADTDNDRVVIFATDGEFIGPFLTSSPLVRPLDLIIGPESRIYISQIEKEKIDVFDKNGELQASIPKDTARRGLNLRPGRMVFDSMGRLLVNNRSSGDVWFITREGKVLKRQNVTRNAEGTRLLTGLAADKNGKIYVMSAQGTPAITVLDTDGAQAFSFGRHGALYDDSLSFPHSLVVDDKGRIYVVDAFRHTIKVFRADSEYISNIGTFGEQPGEFNFPVDMDLDKKGNIYVLEKGAGRLQAISVTFKAPEGLE